MKNNLRELRKAHKLTQQELAKRLDVSRQTIISIESGKYDPSLSLAFNIAYVLSSTIEDIFEPQITSQE
jgi:putative transcriptional regulator